MHPLPKGCSVQRACLTVVSLVALTGGLINVSAQAQSRDLTITLAGQSMIRSDMRTTTPATVPVVRALLRGDVRFTNLEGAVAEPGQSVHEGRGFLMPPAALDALQACGFNLLALADNHAFDLRATGIDNTIHEADRRGLVHAGTGDTLAEAASP